MKLPTSSLFFFVATAAVPLLADATADALAKLGQLPPAPLVITMDQAGGSPALLLTGKGVILNGAGEPVPYDQVLEKLAGLPATAWPIGRVVLISSAAADHANGAPAKADADKIEQDLARANIRALHR